MEGNTIKTLAEYIVRLNQRDQRLEHPELYADLELDTNGVADDYVISSQVTDSHEHPGT